MSCIPKIAVEGCCHGELDAIYAALQETERRQGIKIDLLLCCGDFESFRNEADLECMACPDKYKHMTSFYQYYTGVKKAPFLTIFIGGNHEGSNYLWELYYGGWVADNIYYLGHGGVVNVGGLRLAGLSGIFNGAHYQLGHYERPPYDDGSKRSAYHVREVDVFRLALLQQPIDVFLSHDWPAGIAHNGDTERLFRAKPFLRTEVMNGSLGSPPGAQLLQQLRPRFWFAAHMHVKFAALVQHPPEADAVDVPTGRSATTHFLSLDKCLPRRDYLQVLDVPGATGPIELRHDAEWLAILHKTDSLTNLRKQRRPAPFPDLVAWRPEPELVARFAAMDLRVPLGTPQTVPAYDPARPWTHQEIRAHLQPIQNPQTAAFCALAGIHDPTAPGGGPGPLVVDAMLPPRAPPSALPTSAEIVLDDDLEGAPAVATSAEIVLDDEAPTTTAATGAAVTPAPATSAEISLDDD